MKYYAFAHNADGETVLLGAVPTDTREAAISRYFEMDFSTHPGWYAEGFHLSTKLSIEQREKINGKWVPTSVTVYLCESLRAAGEAVLNSDRKRGGRRISDMVAEATRRALSGGAHGRA